MLPTAGQFRKLGAEFHKKDDADVSPQRKGLSHTLRLVENYDMDVSGDESERVPDFGAIEQYEKDINQKIRGLYYPFGAYEIYCELGGACIGYLTKSWRYRAAPYEGTKFIELAETAGSLLKKIPNELLNDIGAFSSLKSDSYDINLWLVFLHEFEGNQLKEKRRNEVKHVFLKSALACEYLADRLEKANTRQNSGETETKPPKQTGGKYLIGWEHIEGYDPTKTLGEQCKVFKDILLKTNKIRTTDQDRQYKNKLKILTDGERLESDNARLRDAKTLKDFLVVLLDTLFYWDGVLEGTAIGSSIQKCTLLAQAAILKSIRNWITMHRIESTIDLPPTPTDFLGAYDWGKTVEKLLTQPASGTAVQETPAEPNGGKAGTEIKPTEAANVFRKNGDFWFVRFDSKPSEPIAIKDEKGMAYIAELLAKPEKQISAMAFQKVDADLLNNGANLATDDTNDDDFGDGLTTLTAEPLADKETLRETNQRLKELPSEIDKAEKNGDLAKIEKLKTEREKINNYLNDTLIPRSHTAKTFLTEAKKIADTVRKAIHRACCSIQKKGELNSLGTHLKQTILQNGVDFSYKPDRKMDWEL